MNAPGDDAVDATVQVTARTMDTLEVLAHIARHLHPPRIASPPEILGDADAALRTALGRFVPITWPDHLLPFRDQTERAAGLTLRACDGLRAAAPTPTPCGRHSARCVM